MASSARLVGRDTELAVLGDAVTRARGGTTACVIVEGEAGIGKSRLVSEALEAYRSPKDLVAIGHGVELAGGELPYGTVSDALRSLARDAGDSVVRDAAGRYSADLASLCPSLLPPSTETGSVAPSRERLLPAFVSTLEVLAEQRLLWLVVEDLHWVDASSRDLLSYLARVVGPCQLLVLVTTRIHDPAPTRRSRSRPPTWSPACPACNSPNHSASTRCPPKRSPRWSTT